MLILIEHAINSYEMHKICIEMKYELLRWSGLKVTASYVVLHECECKQLRMKSGKVFLENVDSYMKWERRTYKQMTSQVKMTLRPI